MPTIEKTKVATTKTLIATVMMATVRTLEQQGKNQEQQA
jgi:hypothetical protein